MDTWTQVDTCLLPPQRCSSAVCKFLLIPVTEMATHRPLSRFLRHLVPERAEGQGLGRPVMMGQLLCRETKAGACEQVQEGASVLSPPCVLHLGHQPLPRAHAVPSIWNALSFMPHL